jgi:hypothetical protein
MVLIYIRERHLKALEGVLFLVVILALSPAMAQSKLKPKAAPSKAPGRAPATAPARTSKAAPAGASKSPAPAASVSKTPAPVGPPGGLSGGGGEAKALEVRGQARSLQMMMLLKGKGDDIHFVKPRKDFRPEINTTTY